MCQMCMVVATTDTCNFVTGGPVLASITEGNDAPGLRPVPSTPYSIAVGDVFLGTLGAGDQDVVSVSLTAGDRYAISLSGRGTTPGLDTVLELYDSRGNLVASNDDSGTGLNSLVSVTIGATGTYFLLARGYDNAEAGSYRLGVTELPPVEVASLETLSRFLTDGYWESDGGARRSFDLSADRIITVNLTGLTTAGREAALNALEAWEMVVDIDFRTTRGAADITFSDHQAGAFADFVLDGSRIVSSTVNVETAWIREYGSAVGTYGFQTYVHEIGHALGLGHQGAYNGNATYGADEEFANDSWSMSVMSYFDQDDNLTDPGSFGFLLTAMSADIAAIQTLYGVQAGGVTAGATVWGEGTTLTNYLGDWFRALADGTLESTEVALTIYDVGGQDTVNVRSDTTNQRVDLSGLSRWDIFGGSGNVTVAPGTVLEHFNAGSGNDTITGNAAGNRITGNDGNDSLSGLNGSDSLTGNRGGDVLAGGEGSDRLDGSGGRDRLDGGTGSDTLVGGAQSDVFVFASGDDLIRDFVDNVDTIEIEADLFAGVAATWEALQGLGQALSDRIVFSFAGGDSLTVQGITDLALLRDDVLFV